MLLHLALSRKMPILAICLGSQLVNVALGGSLIQEIDEQENTIPHRNHEGNGNTFHIVRIEKDSILYPVVGKDILMVNSSHHQALREVGRGMKVVARSPDGIIEATEAEDGYVLCIQWHPERIIDRPQQLAIFRSFVDFARGYR